MTLADLSIKRPAFAWMLFWGVILFGAISFQKLGISQMPDVDFPIINIQLVMPGASPEVMETNVVDLLEDNLLSVEGVVQINSNSGYGQANIQIELELSRNVDAALQEVQTRVAQAQKVLPATLDPPIITKSNPEDTPIMFVAVTYDGPKRDLMVYVRDILKNQFSTVEGVSQIYMGGFADRNLRIWVDGKKLTKLELTVEDVINAIRKEHIEDPAGLIENSSTQKSVRSMGEVDTVKSFSKIRIPSRGGAPILGKSIFLKDVALIEDGLEDLKRISRLNGKPAVGLGILKQRGTNAVQVAKAVKEKVKRLNSQLPPGFALQISFDSTLFIEESIGELEFILILSIFTTAFVCFLFLGSWSATWNILLSIPTSIIGSFLVMDIFGFTLNTFTLLALSLAIGIVVDDAIMVLENIVRHRENGADQVNAARRGARQITFAALATTLSIVAIFLPVVFMKGVIGRYFFQFGVIISAAVLLSLLEALTLTPMRASKYLEISAHTGKWASKISDILHLCDEIYSKILGICLRYRLTVILGSLLLFILSILSFFPLKKEFVPSMDQSRLLVRLQGKVGSSVAYMDEIAKQCETAMLAEGEVLRVFSSVGGMQGGQANLVNFFVTMKGPKERPKRESGRRLTQNEFSSVLRKKLQAISPELKVSIQDLSTRGFTASRGYPVELSIQGPNWDVLADISEKIKSEMKSSQFFTDVDSSFQAGVPEVLVYPNREAAANFSVNVEAIGKSLEAMIGGVKVGQFTDGGHRYDIRVRLKSDERERPEQIKNLNVRNQRGELVSVSSLVGLEEKITLPTITRKNRERAISIFANPSPKTGQKQAIDEAMKLALKILPKGYTATPTGSSQAMSDSFRSLYVALFLGIAVAYMILASQFNSYSLPALVLLALPFSFSGAIFALWVFNYSLNIYSFIALLLLMGLVKKNSILLVDFTNQLVEKGVPVNEAIQTASPKRLRAILMTSISTIAAAIPPALAIGPGAESRMPMAIAVIGGMLISTALTLVVVPAGYSLIARDKR